MPTRSRSNKARSNGARANGLPLSKTLRRGGPTEKEARALIQEGMMKGISQAQKAVTEVARQKRAAGDFRGATSLEAWAPQGRKDMEAMISAALKSSRAAQREGAKFRKDFMNLTPMEADEHLRTIHIDVWWLAGFSGDDALIRHMRDIASRPRPNARGRSKWPPKVRECAEKAYRQWIKNAEQPHPAWNPSWKSFANACIQQIEKNTGISVSEDSLRRFLLPAKKFRRPQ